MVANYGFLIIELGINKNQKWQHCVCVCYISSDNNGLRNIIDCQRPVVVVVVIKGALFICSYHIH